MAFGDMKLNGFTIRNDIGSVLDERPELSAFVADKILPPLKSSEPNGQIPVVKASTGRTKDGKGDDIVGATDRALNGSFNRGGFDFTEDFFKTKMRGYEMGIEQVEGALLGTKGFDISAIASEIAQNTLLLDREARIAGLVQSTTLFTGSALTGTPTIKWNATGGANGAKAEIKASAQKIFQRTGILQQFLTLALDGDTLDSLIDDLAVTNNVVYSANLLDKPRDVQIAMLTRHLRVAEILETTSQMALSTTADAPNFSKIWDADKASLFYKSRGTNTWDTGLGRQPIWTGYSNDYRVDEYEVKEQMQDIYRVSDYRGEKLFTKYGFLFTNVMA